MMTSDAPRFVPRVAVYREHTSDKGYDHFTSAGILDRQTGLFAPFSDRDATNHGDASEFDALAAELNEEEYNPFTWVRPIFVEAAE